MTSEPVVVVNGAPVGLEVTLLPGSVYTNDTLSATPSGSDPEGDPLTWTYAWFVNGVAVTGAAGETLDGVTHFDRDDEVYVVATPSDGTEVGEPVSSEVVTVLNSAPSAVGVAIDPSLPLIGRTRSARTRRRRTLMGSTPLLPGRWMRGLHRYFDHLAEGHGPGTDTENEVWNVRRRRGWDDLRTERIDSVTVLRGRRATYALRCDGPFGLDQTR